MNGEYLSCEELEKTADIGKGEEMKESQDQTEYDDRWAPLSCRLYIVRGGGDRRGKTHVHPRQGLGGGQSLATTG